MAIFEINIEPSIEKEVSEIYQALGIDIETAIKLFLIRSQMVRGLPFKLEIPVTRTQFAEAVAELREQASNLPEMSLDDINAEISATRNERNG